MLIGAMKERSRFDRHAPGPPKNPILCGNNGKRLAGNFCRYIEGDPRDIKLYGDAIYCGDPQRPESAYCEHHHKLCWQKLDSKMAKSAK